MCLWRMVRGRGGGEGFWKYYVENDFHFKEDYANFMHAVAKTKKALYAMAGSLIQLPPGHWDKSPYVNHLLSFHPILLPTMWASETEMHMCRAKQCCALRYGVLMSMWYI